LFSWVHLGHTLSRPLFRHTLWAVVIVAIALPSHHHHVEGKTRHRLGSPGHRFGTPLSPLPPKNQRAGTSVAAHVTDETTTGSRLEASAIRAGTLTAARYQPDGKP